MEAGRFRTPNSALRIPWVSYVSEACAYAPRAIGPVRRVVTMIRLTRLGGEPFLLNAELIKYVEARPDTFITLTSGDRIVVAESPEEVLREAVEYQQSKQLIPAGRRED